MADRTPGMGIKYCYLTGPSSEIFIKSWTDGTAVGVSAALIHLNTAAFSHDQCGIGSVERRE